MKSLRLFIGLIALAGLAAVSFAATDPLVAKYKQARTRIELLYGNRNEAAAAKPIIENPFRVGAEVTAGPATTGPATTQPGQPAPVLITSEAEQLDAAVRSFGNIGTYVRSGQISVSIQGKTYREGETVAARISPSQQVFVRVKKIAPAITGQRGVITFGLNDLEITVGL